MADNELATEQADDADAVVMRAVGISKVYGGTHALRNVDFEIHQGRVTVLLGENGAGKSTLMKIMSGVEQPTAGTLLLHDQEVSFTSPVAAVTQGVAIIHQELNLCPNLTVADNIFLAREAKRGPIVDDGEQRQRAHDVLQRLEEPIDPTRLVEELSLGQQQLVEIARALEEDARVLIMDEPTSALSAGEVAVLFRVIRDLTAKGVSIVYISHHLDECLEIGDYAVVLRDGQVVAQERIKNVDLAWIVNRMVGRDQSELFTAIETSIGEPVLEVEGLIVPDPASAGRIAVRDIDLCVRAGEVVGIYGLMGAGRTELLECIAGRTRQASGTIKLLGKDISDIGVGKRIDAGLFLVPEDRQRDGLIQGQSVGSNVALASLPSFTNPVGYVSSKAESSNVQQAMASVRVKAAGPQAPIGSLSGGNQQKVVVAKALLTEPKLWILDEPTRGIDVGAKADIFRLMAELGEGGVAVLFATSEVAEVLNSTTRILVMARGRIVAEFDPKTATRELVLAAADDADLPTDVLEGASE